MNRHLLTMTLVLAMQWLAAQSLTVTVNRDSILLGNMFQLTVEVDGAKIDEVDFDLPPVFELVSGPNVATSMTIVNGDVKQTARYTYYVKPLDIGSDYIPPMTVSTDKGILESEPLEVNIYPNPENIQQDIPNQGLGNFNYDFDFNFDDFFGRSQPNVTKPKEEPNTKPKRKLKRI